ncbi:MAG: type II toxin-antitoxin system VapC family toxin [Armatimonadota bacterium]|nr:type II toxin-antitoxin system VapC family toxin [Armatimonadota bacterium]
MRFLLDTHVLLWALAEPGRLARSVRARLESPENEVLFSAASIWEIAVKVRIGRLKLPVAPDEVAVAAARTGFRELPVRAAHAARVIALPAHHRDPFDHLLIAQAMHEPARLLTVDRQLLPYSDLVELIK